VVVLVVLSQFRVAGDMAGAVKTAFLERPHLVDSASGFIRMEVLSPREQPDEIWLFTYWEDEESYRTWHRSHQYKEAHHGIPKGMKLVPKCTSIRFLDHVAN
jgi:heme-degrading monooxygenase HmoA